MKAKGKKFTALFLVFSLLTLSANLYAKKRGAWLIVTKKDGRQTEGELITVKPDSLLLLDNVGRDVSIDIADIRVIRIVKKSKASLGAKIGGVAGTISGITFAAIMDASLGEGESGPIYGYILFGVIGLAAGALAGGLIGALIGAVASEDETIQIEGMTDFHEFREALEHLRKKARIRDYE
jgi:hypothetical protein